MTRGTLRTVAAGFAVTGIVSLLPATVGSMVANAAGSCRSTMSISAPESAPIGTTVSITARLRPCNAAVFDGDCILERRSGSAFITENSGPGTARGTCDFPTSSNAVGTRAYRVRFTGDADHAASVSRTFTIAYVASKPSTGALRVGLAFVDSSVTARGGRGALSSGTTVFPPGATVTGATGCPTSSTGEDGLMVLVMDYNGPPTSAAVTTTISSPETGIGFSVAPYYLDLNAGRRVQFLGPRHQNGTYDILVEYGYASASGFPKLTARFVLDRSCTA